MICEFCSFECDCFYKNVDGPCCGKFEPESFGLCFSDHLSYDLDVPEPHTCAAHTFMRLKNAGEFWQGHRGYLNEKLF